ncbi:hypothetical protein CDD82_3423 [Ophiocordyceps australis]|uniref:rRNA methyltransferase 1, mitochondrial n=1 Tax=Ophiocordyceps australis TaxID=1399860 RepID=A0A2C5ZTG9_9HYPO|nr:hypothetical protein CDD82_3423 [Ophiocordyceps australis]
MRLRRSLRQCSSMLKLGVASRPGFGFWMRWAGNLSSIHRGIRLSEKAEGRNPRRRELRPFRQPQIWHRNSDWKDDELRTKKAMAGAASDRQRARLAKKLERKKARREEALKKEEENERMTRRKRFLDPNQPFGKESLVYHLKYGKLKDLVSNLKLPESGRSESDQDTKNTLESETEGSKGAQRPRTEPASSTPKGSASAPKDEVDEDDSFPDKYDWESEPEPESTYDWDENPEEALRRSRFQDVPSATTAMMEERYASHLRHHEAEDKAANKDVLARIRHPLGFRGKKHLLKEASKPPTPSATFVGLHPLATAASQFLYGRTVVQAALESRRRRPYRLYVYGGPERQPTRAGALVMELARGRGIPINMVTTEGMQVLDKMSGGRPHNGIVLEASPLPMPPVYHLRKLRDSPAPGFEVQLNWQSAEDELVNGTETIVFQSNPYGRKPLILLLVGILDPGNLGAILRTAGYLGVDGVGITKDKSVGLTSTVLKAAAGAVENLNIFDVDDPFAFVMDSQKAGWVGFAAVTPPSDKLRRLHPDRFMSQRELEDVDPLSKWPCIVVFGNEGFGISKTLRVLSRFELSVPRFSYSCSVDSLNVSVAAGLLCHSFLRKGQSKSFDFKNIGPVSMAVESKGKANTSSWGSKAEEDDECERERIL